MTDKNSIKYGAFIDKESGTIVCNTLTTSNIVATSMQLNVTGNNPQGLSIIGTPTSDDATQIFFQSVESGTITNHWQLGPNFTTANPPDFWLYNDIGRYNVFQIHANEPLVDIYSSVNINDTLTVNTAH